MPYYVYMIKTIGDGYSKSYVGYTNNINNRIKKHNEKKGAKSTKGYKWELVYHRKFVSKSAAMSYEYKLKKDKIKRKKILDQK
jgi:putative endonuclease